MKLLRKCSLQIETSPDAQGKLSTVTIPQDLTIEFDINRQGMGETQTASFKIMNLAERTRNLIYRDSFVTNILRAIQFRAGFEDSPYLPICFNGTVISCTSSRPGNTWITEIDAFDGGFAMTKGYTSMTVCANQTIEQTLQNLAKTLPNTAGNPIVGSFPATNKRAMVLMGNTWNIINQMSQGLAFIDNGQVKILNYNEAIDTSVPVINSATGLLGTPKRTPSSLEFEMLFEPRLTLGQVLDVQSSSNKAFNGAYKVMGIHHNGTISPSVAGPCKSTVSMFFGHSEFTRVTQAILQ
jgi:hypothetical protein